MELADSWWDWINWNYLGYQGPGKDLDRGNSFVPDRNAGIWKPVYLKVAGAVTIGPSVVNTELPLPRTDSARLAIHTTVHNYSTERVRGVLRARITRAGKPNLDVEQPVTLLPGQDRDVTFAPDEFAALTVANPDLWWPYTLGDPNLYDLRLEFEQFGQVSDATDLKFGVRSVAQHRDSDGNFPDLGKGGNFYLTVNGRDLLVRERPTRRICCTPTTPSARTRSCVTSRISDSTCCASRANSPASTLSKKLTNSVFR